MQSSKDHCLSLSFCTAPLNSSYRSAGRPGAVVYQNHPVHASTHIQQVGEVCLSGTNMQQVDSRRSTALYGHAILHPPSTTPLALCLDEPRPTRPTPSVRISRYRTWQGPRGLASLDRDPVRLRNTVRPDAALPPCRHYKHQNSTQVQRFHGVGPCLAGIDSLAGDFRCQTRRRARARRAAELHQTTCRIDADARDATVFQQRRSQIGSASIPCNERGAAHDSGRRNGHLIRLAIRTLTDDVVDGLLWYLEPLEPHAGCLAAAAAAQRFVSPLVACLLAAWLAPPAEALYPGVHAGTSCMHFFGLDTKAARSEASRLPLVSRLSSENQQPLARP